MLKQDQTSERLRSIDRILRAPEILKLISAWGRYSVTDAIRAVQENLRSDESAKKKVSDTDYRDLAIAWLRKHRQHGYQPVFNLTGTLVHTNLGRATLDRQLVDRAAHAATRPVSLEYDLRRGGRGNREAVVSDRLCHLTGAESAIIVNNNAAAVWITLNTLAYGREVVVSRGELIEIGGSFRLPELMARSECKLVEVGTTNRTWLKDYESSITSETALLLKVHPSNYSIRGFTHSVSELELIELAQRKGVPLMLDLGSGALTDLRRFGLPAEPQPNYFIEAGVDLITFSGDKLMGGPQAGIIVGTKRLCEQINANPLKRALRMNKFSLALLDETLKAYEDPDNLHKNVQLIRDLTVAPRQLKHRAAQILAVLEKKLPEFKVKVCSSAAQLGSGSQPDTTIPTIAVTITHSKQTALIELEQRLRGLTTPVIGRISKKQIFLDMRGADPLDELLKTVDALV